MAKEKTEVLDILIKRGDQHADDLGYKDGDLVSWQPVTGVDCFGQPRYIGPSDRKHFVIVRVLSTKEEIKGLFKTPHKNSNAYKRGRKSYYFMNLEEVFTPQAVAEYRDHDKEVEPQPIPSLADFSDYRIDKKRHDKTFVPGSIKSGLKTIGQGGEFSHMGLFLAAISGDIGDNTLIGQVISDNDIGDNNITLSNITSETGLIQITSNKTFAGFGSYRTSTTSALKSFVIDGGGNYLIEYQYFEDIALLSTSNSVSTRETTVRNCVIASDKIQSAGLMQVTLSNGVKVNKIYNLVLYANTDDSIVLLGINVNDDAVTTAFWNATQFIQNLTLIYRGNGSNPTCVRVYSNNTGYTYTFRNILMFCENDAKKAIMDPFSGGTGCTWKLVNCARRGITDFNDPGDLVEQDCITGITTGDLLAIDKANDNCAKIGKSSIVYAAGSIDILPENTVDIIGADWYTFPSIGACSGYIKPAEIATLLPHNATPQERALEATTARPASLYDPGQSLPIADLWNPDKCPVKHLPWLAWTLSVDIWDSTWPEAKMRAVIAASVDVHRKKGTPYAIRTALEAAGFTDVVISEAVSGVKHDSLFRHDGYLKYDGVAHWTIFGISTSSGPDHDTLVKIVTTHKPVRSRLYSSTIDGDTQYYLN